MSNFINTRTAFRPSNVGQNVSHTTGGSTSIATEIATDLAMIWSTTGAYVAIGKTPTAASTTGTIPANTPVYVSNCKGEKIAFRAVTSAGTGYVTELTS